MDCGFQGHDPGCDDGDNGNGWSPPDLPPSDWQAPPSSRSSPPEVGGFAAGLIILIGVAAAAISAGYLFDLLPAVVRDEAFFFFPIWLAWIVICIMIIGIVARGILCWLNPDRDRLPPDRR